MVASGTFKHSVGVALTAKGRRLQRITKEDAEKGAASVIVGCGNTVTDIVGIACHFWSASKCLDLPTCLRAQMAAQKPFTMPMFRHQAAVLGLMMPDIVDEHSCLAEPYQSSSDEDDIETADEHERRQPTKDNHRSLMVDLLMYLELSSMLKSSANVKRVLVLAAQLLGGWKPELESTLRVPHRSTLSRARVKLDIAMLLWRQRMF